MRNLSSGALSVLLAFGLTLSLSTVASANPIVGGGYSSSYAGESVFTNNAAGETGQFAAIFFNDGQVAWLPGVVGLLICAPDKVTCNVSQNASFAKNWFSSTVYTTATSTVAPGENGFFVYNFTVPAGTPVGAVTTFYGDVGLIATGAELHPQGYFQVNTTPIIGVANRTTVTSNDTPHPASGSGTCTVAGSQAGTNTNVGCTTIVVAVRDASGSLVTSDSGRAITVSFDSSTCTGATPGNATLADSTTTSSGSATLVFKSAGAYPNCRITFSSGSLTGTSTTATWTSGAADHLSCSFSPTPIPPDNTSISVGTVAVRDTAGNVVTTGSYSVSFSRTAGATTTFQPGSGTNPQTTTAGYAYFTVKSGTTPGADTYTPTTSGLTTLPGTSTSCTIAVQ